MAKMERPKLTICKTIKKYLYLLKKINLNMGKRAMIWTVEQEFIVKGGCERYCYITTHFAQYTSENRVVLFEPASLCDLFITYSFNKHINDRSMKY